MKDSGTFNMMFVNALHGLENGCLMPWDKQILASAPLPDSVIDPFTTKEAPDVLSTMKMTYDAMVIWVDEAKKVSYFSERFVQLSKMIMNGVTTMARGLITLHGRGEDLEASPMSIKDLLDLSSYHFRKSYLGVLQTSKTRPDIGERLLMNQIRWCNMLMRLFKTRDKLDTEVKIRKPENAVLENQAVPGVSGSDEVVKALPSSDSRAFSAPFAYTEQGAFHGAQAFKSYDGGTRSTGSRSKKADCGSPVPASQTAEQAAEPAPAATLKRETEGMDTEKAVTEDLKDDAVNAEQAAAEAEPKEMINTTDGHTEEKDPAPEISEETELKTEAAKTESMIPELPEESPEQTDQDSGKEESKESSAPENAETGKAEEPNEAENSPSDRVPDPERDAVLSPPEEPPEKPVDPWLEYDIRDKLWHNPWGWDEVRFLLNEDLYCSRHPEHVRIFKKLLKEIEEKGRMDPPDAAYRY